MVTEGTSNGKEEENQNNTIERKLLTVTPTPHITMTPTPTPAVTPQRSAAEVTQAPQEEETGSGGVYLEEADARKARRREALAAQENAEQASGNASQTETAASTEAHETYVIRPGDTLYQISISHYGSMDEISEICRLNGLAENEIIYPGQVIVLP